jgi:hypothetical protein
MLNNLGLSMAVNGQPSEGEREVERGKEIRERLLAEQPVNLDYRADLARSYYHLARIHLLSNAAEKAKADIRMAQELYSTIPPKGPEDIYFQAGMKALHAGLQTVGKADSELTAAARADRDREAGEAVALLKQAVAAGYSNPSRYRTDAPLNSLRTRPDFSGAAQVVGPTATRRAKGRKSGLDPTVKGQAVPSPGLRTTPTRMDELQKTAPSRTASQKGPVRDVFPHSEEELNDPSVPTPARTFHNCQKILVDSIARQAILII